MLVLDCCMQIYMFIVAGFQWVVPCVLASARRASVLHVDMKFGE